MPQVRCDIRGVFVAVNQSSAAPAVVLKDESGHQIPIFIGLWEAVSISSAINKESSPRPFTHDLFLDLMKRYSISVSRLIIDSCEEGVYYANLFLEKEGRDEILDCRPSDGIAIALRSGAPIFIEEELIVAGSQDVNPSDLLDLAAFLQM